MEFDENKAIEYINLSLIKNGRQTYPDDELLNIIDMIWDYYEENGLLDIDADDDDEATPDELSEYVERMLKKDKGANIKPEDIRTIVDAELKYEESLDEM